MADKIIPIALFDNYLDAQLACQMLEDAGIKCSITGEAASNTFSGLPGLSRIELQVFEQDADKAKEILSEKPESTEQQEQND